MMQNMRFAHRDYEPKPQETGSGQVRKWSRGKGATVSFSEPESFAALSFEQTCGCIHASMGSLDSQAPKEAFSEELGECGGQGGWGAWSATHLDHGG